MEPLVEQHIASMADVPVEEWDPRFRQALTTMLSRALQFMPNTTPYSKQDSPLAEAPQSTSQISPASSAPTSSSTPKSKGS